ncbi:MAG: acyl-CoA dehydrogenase family protein [Acidimicrobiia bacterium]|nr:acyl-CoA dehydrogenase family protein [Acidimicrobiia bacterium]
MTATDEAPTTSIELVDEIRTWLSENWDPDLTVGEWWERMGLAGWSHPALPTNAYGRDLSRSDANLVAREFGAHGALGAPGGLGLLLAAPTIATHGTQEQIDTFVRDIVTGRQAWCQLFSEPGAGSDLAGLGTRAELDGDEWVVNGQKVWTSLGQTADMGMLIARTNPDAPKHQGITWFAIDMHQEGVDVRPLIELTGHAMFNEVFLSDARVPAGNNIGDVNNGWAVTNTTLMHERAGLGAGGGSGGGGATPGTIADQLGRRAGDLAGAPAATSRPRPTDARRKSLLHSYAEQHGKTDDPLIRQDLARLHTLTELGRFNTERTKAARAAGKDIPGMPNIGKLSMSNIVRLSRDLGLRLAGPAGTLHAYADDDRKTLDEATGDPLLAMITFQALYAQAPPIYGGTDQIQRNIIGERVLGLPKEPGDTKNVPFSDLPKNQ